MTWRDGLFAHWPVDPDELRHRIPGELKLETRDGRAWVSVLPFVLANVGVRGSPPITRTAFPELNVRTYVRYGGDSGLLFFSIDVGAPLLASLVRRTTRLPVRYARIQVSTDGTQVAFSSRRSRSRSRNRDASGARVGPQDGFSEVRFRGASLTRTRYSRPLAHRTATVLRGRTSWRPHGRTIPRPLAAPASDGNHQRKHPVRSERSPPAGGRASLSLLWQTRDDGLDSAAAASTGLTV
ncbi:hypothetical protein C446_01036 [Halobiforma nitratireducens JCM 10879]|uniref:DUF2071 domain-containing protein n=1 Tax=Halobiforma nitratireducens JCM 10879 TaxID=1227454 RepID=M0MLQ9_9EURY|nr:hypothetical protein C446_01036 [Halobiforma nitratireducens JCM 10879]